MAWNQPDMILDPAELDWTGNFDDQVNNVMANVRLTRADVDSLSNLFADLGQTLQCIWPGCQVMPFGSIVTGLGILSSDVDCYIDIPEHYEHNQVKFVKQAKNVLQNYHWIFKKIFAITAAKVPIVKLYHAPTGRNCDLSFKSPAGVRNSKLIAYLIHMDRRVLPLCVLIKYWSKVHKLTGTNLLPNYSLTMLIIFYLQQVNILPSVSFLQRRTNQKCFVEMWNTAFAENYYHNTDNTQSLYELLGGFFQFYSTYDFEKYIVSIFLGESIPRQYLIDLNKIPDEFYNYKIMVTKKEIPPIKINTQMCIQDMFEHNRNCVVAVYPRLFMCIMLHIKLAAQIFAENSSKHFLRLILMRKPDIPKPPQKNRPILKSFKNNKAKQPVIPQADRINVIQPEPRNLKRPAESLTNLFITGRSNSKKGRRN